MSKSLLLWDKGYPDDFPRLDAGSDGYILVADSTSPLGFRFVSPSALSNLDASDIASGTLADARLSANIPKMVAGVLPAVSGALLTNLPSSSNPRTSVTLLDEFVTEFSITTAKGPFGFKDGSFGVGASANVGAAFPTDSSILGELVLSTGTTNTGTGNFVSVMSQYLGGGQFINEIRSMIPVLSTGGEAFTFRAGLYQYTSTDGTDGIYWRYTDTENGGKWVGVCRRGGVETVVNDPGAAIVAGTYYDLKIVVNAARTSVEFFVNGVSIGTSVTNIPGDVGHSVGFGGVIEKSAGTTARKANLDYFTVTFTPTAR